MVSNFREYNFSSGAHVYQGEISRYQGKLLEKKMQITIRPLNLKDCDAMGELSSTVYESLGEDEQNYMRKYDREYFAEAMKYNPNITYFGTYAGGKLVSMSCLKILRTDRELEYEMPGCEADFLSRKRNVKDPRVAVFCSDSVHPDFRGNGINTVMIAVRIKYAAANRVTDCACIVDRSNIASMRTFFNNNFNIFETGIDPTDNGRIALMHRPIADNVVTVGSEKTRFNNFNIIDRMMKMNRVGVGYDTKTQQLVFGKTDYYAKLPRRNNNLMYNKEMVNAKAAAYCNI